VRSDDMVEPRAFTERCAEWGATQTFLPMAVFNELARALAAGEVTFPDTFRYLMAGGDAAVPERVAEWRRSVDGPVQLVDMYGPTETTSTVVGKRLYPPDAADAGEGTLAIGRPMPNVRAYVVDANLNPLPSGAPGELLIGGPGLGPRDPQPPPRCGHRACTRT